MSVGFKENLMISIGDGSRAKFRKDPWLSDGALCDLFPRLFTLSEQKEALVAEVGSFRVGRWHWNLIFRRVFFEWEQELYSQLRTAINSLIPAVGKMDETVWCLNQNGLFAVKDLCLWFEGQLFSQQLW